MNGFVPRVTEREGALPNLVIIGAMKCGTTSLHYYLGLHPEIKMSSQKELQFFIEERNWNKGVDWYRSWFPRDAPVRGEASPHYTTYPKHQGIAERMHAVVPKTKLIYLVRDPIERLISHYVHYVADNIEDSSLEEMLHDVGRGYLDRSRYFMQLEQYLSFYSKDDILVVEQKKLREQRQKTLRRVFEFLGVDPDFYDPRVHWERHRSDRKRRKTDTGLWLEETRFMRLLRRLPKRVRWPMEDLLYWPFSRPVERPQLSDALRREIETCLRDDVRRLRAFTDKEFETWSL